MQTIVLDQATRAKFHNLSEVLELRDESGRVLGHFVPANQPAAILNAVGSSCPHTDEEIEELRKQTGGRPLKEIWKSLGRAS